MSIDRKALQRVIKLQMPVITEQLLAAAAGLSDKKLCEAHYVWTDFRLPDGTNVQVTGSLRLTLPREPERAEQPKPRKPLLLEAPPLRLKGPL